MNFKKNLKRFMTLDRHHAEGFTLVELIVVIAILAILGGVALPAYSGYITKANKQADISLLGDIEHALELAYYNGDLSSDVGYLIISPESAEDNAVIYDTENSGVVLAMQKTFGSGWEDMMQLKYNGWGVTSMTMSAEQAKNVVDSAYVKNYTPGELMSQVSALTTAVDGLSTGSVTIDLKNMYNYGDGKNAIDDVIKEYYGESKTWDDFNSQEQSNLLVLATASSINNKTGASANSTISDFALLTAFAAEDQEFNVAYQNFQTAISNVDPDKEQSEVDQIKSAYGVLLDAAADNDYETWKNNNSATNSAAFTEIMKGVGNAMKGNKDGILGDLSNPDMFTSGVGSQLYNDYLSAAYAIASDASGMIAGMLSALQSGAEEYAGCVLAWYSVVNGNLYVGNSLPLN